MDLAIATGGQSATFADGYDRGVKRIVDPGLEGGIEKRKLPYLGR